MTRKLNERKIVIATHNAGKLQEIAELMRPRGIEVVSAGALNLREPAETETSFEGNARIKAHAAASASGLPALSDDSGLSVAALGGAPGVYTADWAETPGGRDFVMAMEKVWRKLQDGGHAAPYVAAFNCALCVAWPNGEDAVFVGRVEGTLVWPPRGDRGFGFDPMFLPTGERETFGEMDPARKHGMSHRAGAFAQLTDACFD
ncbi:MAG: non-canonical purine NTP pyrophosphatase [Pseudomonadota bacterium]